MESDCPLFGGQFSTVFFIGVLLIEPSPPPPKGAAGRGVAGRVFSVFKLYCVCLSVLTSGILVPLNKIANYERISKFKVSMQAS